ncbi:9241_t:CDS:10 [Paraglomus brasilianum]|uniref:9241_t:CDS:1 n=1 Tax=Paraglomus brasilianum TaxID=144538 RepID=A0A9N8ZFE0_9GLOM|nr:9241_t:CDS:10 [Paraglomus brasilianum]
MSATKDVRVVVGVDFGTTFSGFSVGHIRRPKDVETYMKWSNIYERSDFFAPLGRLTRANSHKIPTVLVYDKDFKVVQWGNSAADCVEDYGSSLSSDDYCVVECFKLCLSDTCPTARKPLLPDGLSYRKAITDFLKEMQKKVETHIKSRWGSATDIGKHVLFVFTLPVEWNHKAKDIMTRCAVDAGLVQKGMENAMFISEPEAAAVYCHELMDQYDLTEGSTFMIVDGGGGTVDITTRKLLTDKQLGEVAQSMGNYCGSTSVDDEFINQVAERLGITRDRMAELRKIHARRFMYLIQNFFCPIKFNFNERSEYVNNRISMRAYDFLKAEASAEKKALLEPLNWLFEFTYDDIKTMFEPSIQAIIDLIRKQLKASSDRCSAMFLVGGYSQSPYLMERVKQTFGYEVDIIASPINPIAAIQRGATLYGLSIEDDHESDLFGFSKTVKTRVLNYSYGTNIEIPFAKDDPPERKTERNTIIKFSILARRGDSVRPNQTFSEVYYPSNARQTKMSVNIYASRDYDPEYVDDEGVSLIREWIIDLPDKHLGKDRPIELSLTFGNYETKVNAKNPRTNTECSVTFKCFEFGV